MSFLAAPGDTYGGSFGGANPYAEHLSWHIRPPCPGGFSICLAGLKLFWGVVCFFACVF